MLFKKIPNWLRILFFALVPLVIYFLVERLQGTFQSPLSANFWLNILFYYGFSFLLYGITKSFFLYTLIPGLLMWLLGVVNHYMIIIRNKALLPWDLFALTTVKNVADNAVITIDLPFALSLGIIVVVCVLAFFLRKTELFNKARYVVLSAGAAMFAALWLILVFAPPTVSFDPWFTVDSSRQNGMAVNVLNNMKSLINRAPKGYSVDRVREIIGDNETEGSATPDIVVIMDESFADLSRIADLQSEKDYIPFFHSISENAITGTARVSVFGGGTCNTEYDFLTGNATPLLRPGSYPMTQFIGNSTPSIASSLKARGYRTIGLHSFYPNGWNRDTAYPSLGFDKFLSNQDFTNPGLVREYISDKATFDKLKALLDEDTSSPTFIFNVTMQNHFAYDRAFDNLPETAVFPEMEQFPQARRYFSLLTLTDNALRDFMEYLENRSRPTILLFFGDHLPAFEAEYYDVLQKRAGLSDEDMKAKKQTVPFFIWANYPIEEKHDVNISISFLAPILLDNAGVGMTEHQNYLLDLINRMPIWEEGDEENLNEYKMVQHNMVFDKFARQGDLYE